MVALSAADAAKTSCGCPPFQTGLRAAFELADGNLQRVLRFRILVGALAVALEQRIERQRRLQSVPHLRRIGLVVNTFTTDQQIGSGWLQLPDFGANG